MSKLPDEKFDCQGTLFLNYDESFLITIFRII